MCESLSRLPARILHVSLLKSPNSSTPSAAKIKKRSMKRRPRFPTCRETTGGGRDSVRGVLPTHKKKKRIEINVLCSKSTQQKMYGRYGLAPPQTHSLRMTAIGLSMLGCLFLPVQRVPCSTLPTPQFPIHPPSFRPNTVLP